MPPHSLDPQGMVFEKRRTDQELFLNDIIINAYLAQVRGATPHPQEFYVANTFFFETTRRKTTEEALQMWS